MTEMNSVKMEHLSPEYERIQNAKITGKRIFSEITFNPKWQTRGGNLLNLVANMCLVPNTLFLTAKFKSGNAKSWFLNNLRRLLVSSLVISDGGKIVHDNTNESINSVYNDL